VVTKTFPRRQDADRYARLIEADRVHGIAVDPRAGAGSLADYAARWLDQRRVRGRPLAPRTVELYADLLAHHALPTLGHLDVGKLTTEGIRTWHAELGRATTPMAVRGCPWLSVATVARIWHETEDWEDREPARRP